MHLAPLAHCPPSVWLSLIDSSCYMDQIEHLLSFASPAVAPDTINNHVKTCYEEQKNLHFYAPEYGGRLVFMVCVCLCCYLSTVFWPECTRLWRSSPLELFILVLTILFVHFFVFFPYFRWWCHHSCGYLLIWHVCLGGETCLLNSPEASFTLYQHYLWPCLWMCVDGTPRNPWEWRVLLCFSGRHQQRHSVSGGPAAEGAAYVYIFVRRNKSDRSWLWKVLFVYWKHFSSDMWPICVCVCVCACVRERHLIIILIFLTAVCLSYIKSLV